MAALVTDAYSYDKIEIASFDDDTASLEFEFETKEDKLLVTGMYTSKREIAYDHEVVVTLLLTEKLTDE